MSKQHTLLPGPLPQQRAWFPLKMMIALATAILVIAVFAVVVEVEREKKQMLANMRERANVFIWALERSARSKEPMRRNHMRRLIAEVAQQPQVAYIAMVATDGRISVHSDPSRVGTILYPSKALKNLAVDDASKSRVISLGGKKMLEVYKVFTPSQPCLDEPDSSLCNQQERMEPSPDGHPQRPEKALSNELVFVGIETLRFDEELWDDVAHHGVISALVGLSCFIGIALLFYIQNYKLSRRMLKDTQALAMQVINSHPAALVVTDEQGLISLTNRHGQAILKLADGKAAPRSVHDLPFLNWQPLMDELDAGAVILERNTELTLANSHILPVSISAAKIIGGGDGFTGYLFILRDLTEIRKLEKQAKQNERLSALGNLAAGVAHEIRNPLSSIRGYATYLTEKVKDDKMAFTTGNMLIQETERLNRVVSDLLSVARPLELRLQPARMDTVLERAVRLIAPDAEAKGIKVQLRLLQTKKLARRQIMLDADRFMQALLNLLVNAVQATEAGGSIQISLENSEPGAESSFLAISVTDTGCGMSLETMANLFTPYFTTKASGTGLGLIAAQQIVKQHGGEIEVSSRAGKGTTFTILLPWAHIEGSGT
ncbi:MAG TPA: PAS domain-containing sensor histidine kinase [Desulfobulbaceae bacterium]|nr:PAS domain-containing sensor histidine kinase [Desulfobulbaceae bacterium]